MFFCEECHDKETRCYAFFMHLPSHGKCESCGKVKTCGDCHNY